MIRFSFPDQHGILRGKTVTAAELPKALADGVTVTSTLFAKDTSHKTVFPVFTRGGGFGLDGMEGGADALMIADPTTFRVLPWAPQHRLAAVRSVLRERRAGAVRDPAVAPARARRGWAKRASSTSPGSRSSSTSSAWSIRACGRRTPGSRANRRR